MEAKIDNNKLLYFFYKDVNLIESFYAQLFGGNPESISRSMQTSESSGLGLRGGLPIASGEKTGQTTETSTNAQIINPHDFKVLQLISKLDLKQIDLLKVQQSQLVKATGSAKFLSLDDLLPIAIPMLSDDDFDNKIRKEDAVALFREFKIGTSLYLRVKETGFSVPLNPNYLALNSLDISMLYGTSLPGEYSVLGIYHRSSKSDEGSFFGEIQDGIKMFAEDNLGVKIDNQRIIVPLLIYQEIVIA